MTTRLQNATEDVTSILIEEGIPENFWNDIYDKLGIPANLRGVNF
ncbi:hypothetical protein [Listeria booriae]|nr:hypothetical protein [Listeria booriae]